MLLIVYSIREVYAQQVVYKHGNYSKKELMQWDHIQKGPNLTWESHEEID